MQPSQLSEPTDSGSRMFEEQPQLEESFTIHLGLTTLLFLPFYQMITDRGWTRVVIAPCFPVFVILVFIRGSAKDDAQPASGPGGCAQLLQASATRQRRRKAASAADGAVALLLLPLWSGAVGGQQGHLLQWHQERSLSHVPSLKMQLIVLGRNRILLAADPGSYTACTFVLAAVSFYFGHGDDPTLSGNVTPCAVK